MRTTRAKALAVHVAQGGRKQDFSKVRRVLSDDVEDWFEAVAVFTVYLSASVVGHCFRQANARPAMSRTNKNPEFQIDRKTLFN
jgi:hypothetical protein